MVDGTGKGNATVRTEAKEVSLRRVYALPAELVDRIVAYQQEKGFASEVEAVRKLLDDALKSRDDLERILNRFLTRLRSLRLTSEVARNVIVGHPLVKSIEFGDEQVTFRLTNGSGATITDGGKVWVFEEGPDFDGKPKWKKEDPEDAFSAGRIVLDSDDDIPF